jgi:hypothetical protein
MADGFNFIPPQLAPVVWGGIGGMRVLLEVFSVA